MVPCVDKALLCNFNCFIFNQLLCVLYYIKQPLQCRFYVLRRNIPRQFSTACHYCDYRLIHPGHVMPYIVLFSSVTSQFPLTTKKTQRRVLAYNEHYIHQFHNIRCHVSIITNSCTHSSIFIKNTLKVHVKFTSTCFGSQMEPSSGGSATDPS